MKHKLMLLSLLIAASYSAAAQENFSSKLSETIVTEDTFGNSVLETPKNVTVITAEEIEERGAQSIEQALKVVPGLTAYSNKLIVIHKDQIPK